MEVQVEELGPCRKKLNVSLPADQVKSHVEELFVTANKQYQMKGFRPGKIPRKILEKQFGEAIIAQAREDLVEKGFREAILSQKLDVIGTPKVELSEEEFDVEKPFTFLIELEIKPQVKVGKVKDIEIESMPTEITEEEIENGLKELATAKRKLGTVDEPIQEGDFIKVDQSFLLDGNPLLERKGLQIHTGIPVAGTDPEEFKAKLIGQKKGNEVELPLTFPDNFEKEEARGKTGILKMKILEALRFQAPAIDDAFAKTYEFEDLEALKKELRTRMGEEKDRQNKRRIEEEALDVLFAENPFDLPGKIIEEETEGRLKQFIEELKRGGASEEQAKAQAEEARSEAEEDAKRTIRNLFLIEAIAKKEKLFVTETDVRNELQVIASENKASLDDVQKEFETRNLFGELRLELMSRKVRNFLRESVTMTDKKGTDSKEADKKA
jgi:trigger factor